MSKRDKLGMNANIDRRQFCQGVSVALGANLMGFAGRVSAADAAGTGYYPPGKTGLRGTHDGAFEVAHGLVHEGKTWPSGAETGEGKFDLVIVGAGLSGLSAAYFFRAARPDAKILILDNHDDFGGHAKRNEFTVGNKKLIGYGGSQSIDTPGDYSPAAKRLLQDLGVDVGRFFEAFDTDKYTAMGMTAGVFVGDDMTANPRLVLNDVNAGFGAEVTGDDPETFAEAVTDNDTDRAVLYRMLTSSEDMLAGLSGPEKVKRLRAISYDTYLRTYFAASDYIVSLYARRPKGLWGVGTDAISALEGYRLGLPGYSGMALDLEADDPYYLPHGEEPYIFHFPDGNASLARMLVRKLIPGIAPGNTMDDIVRARFDYTKLDRPDAKIKIRLNATAVKLQADGLVRYVKAGKAYDVRADHVIYAGYGAMLTRLCPDLPDDQKEAILSAVKVPLVYTNVVLRNWRPFVEQGVHTVHFASGFFDWAVLDFPVSMGGYEFSKTPDDPIVVHMSTTPAGPGDGSDARDQFRYARYKLLEMTFEDYELAVREQLTEALGPAGFNAAEDILAITVNRWPHGYAYEYIDLFDDPAWSPAFGPHHTARKTFGKISMAGSDMAAKAYVNGAIDAAWFAVGEQLKG